MPGLPTGALRALPIVPLMFAFAAAPARAAATHSDAKWAAIVHSYQGCLTVLSPSDQAVLVQRFGTATTGPTGTPATTAAEQQTELKAIRRLEAAHRAGRCTTPAADPAAQGAVQAAHTVRAPPSATDSSSGLSWTSPTELILLAIILLALAALGYGLRRDFGRPRVADWQPPGEARRRWPRRRRRP